eukprot:TRINITY_DN5760_c0_g1_i3.p1 TRINITY_DN5760_c0_g1~~TRINITY_DN5760_c0_g1_i3.p1  ORF type:complete len:162 (+),score=16.50 TRINITY_DN5760_c0_g1_i3:157-642(+)
MSCMTIMNSPMLSMGLLFMGEGSEIPLHDHPGMLVTSKVLAGELFTFSRMDLMEIEDDPLEAFTAEAVFREEATFTEGDIFNLTPLNGNVHCFRATRPTIILDLLTPNYEQDERDCNYYRLLSKSAGSLTNGAKVNLQYLLSPEQMTMNVVKYTGTPLRFS